MPKFTTALTIISKVWKKQIPYHRYMNKDIMVYRHNGIQLIKEKIKSCSLLQLEWAGEYSLNLIKSEEEVLSYQHSVAYR